MRIICALKSAWYSFRYWWKGGAPNFSVDGHEYGEPTYGRSYRSWAPGHGGPIEIELLTCKRCGHSSEGWRWLPFGS